jgi:hypothetical protein
LWCILAIRILRFVYQNDKGAPWSFIFTGKNGLDLYINQDFDMKMGSTFSISQEEDFRIGSLDFTIVKNDIEYDSFSVFKKILQILYYIVKIKKSNKLSPGFTEIQIVSHGG